MEIRLTSQPPMKKKLREALFRLSPVVIAAYAGPSLAGNWCTVTHTKFNGDYVKRATEGEPFQIGRVDGTGHKLGLIEHGKTNRYTFLRDVAVDGSTFREFRNNSMIFQLGLPGENGMMVYQRFWKDSTGTERGFAGVCSGE